MKKRILALLMALVMAVALAACGGGRADPVTPPTEGDDTPPVEAVCIAAEDLRTGLVLIGDDAHAYSFYHIEVLLHAMSNIGLE